MRTAYCAFNIERQSFVNLGVTVADTTFARLRGLIGKMRLRSNEALWIVPSRGIHTIGVMFPIDVLYLDPELRVIDAIEYLGPLRIAPIHWHCSSVLMLPAGSIGASDTVVGDRLLVGTPEDLDRYWAEQRQAKGPAEREFPRPPIAREELKKAI